MSDEKYDATRRAAITPGVALWAAVSFSTGTRLTDEQVERALRSLEANNWRLIGPHSTEIADHQLDNRNDHEDNEQGEERPTD